jgi:hypothetical protein
MRNAKRLELLAKRADAIRAGLAAGATLDSLAAPYGGLRDSGPLTRGNSNVPGLGDQPRILERAFATRPGAVSDTIETALGVAWVRPGTATVVPGAAFEKDAPMIESELLTLRYRAWLEERRKAIGVQILRADLRPPAPLVMGAPAATSPAARSTAARPKAPRTAVRPANR